MSVQSTFKGLLVLAVLVLATPALSLTVPTKPPSRSTLIHYCRALYLGDVESPEDRGLVADQRTARHYFGSRTVAELSGQLVPIRKSLHAGTYSYVAVAYVLAYYGVDTYKNVKRICTTLDTPKTTENPLTERDGKEIEEENAPDSDLGHDNAVDAIRRVYERHPSDSYWVVAFKAWEHGGSVSEAHPGYLAEAFLRHPASVLRAALRVKTIEREPSMVGLAYILTRYGYDPTKDTSVTHPHYSRVRAALRKLRKSGDITLSRAAGKLSRAFDKTLKTGL